MCNKQGICYDDNPKCLECAFGKESPKDELYKKLWNNIDKLKFTTDRDEVEKLKNENQEFCCR